MTRFVVVENKYINVDGGPRGIQLDARILTAQHVR